MLNLEQRKALTAEIKHLESRQQVLDEHDHSDHNLNQEIEAKRTLLNSLGGEF